jgi:hypothetical protein
MPVDVNDYRARGGNLAIVLCCLTIVSPARLVYFDYNPAGSWVIRDFLGGVKLSNETSALTVADIELDANHSEPPPWCNVATAPQDWWLYLELRMAVLTEQRNRNIDAAQRRNRISAYIWNSSGGEGAGAYFEDPNLESGAWIHIVACYDAGDWTTDPPAGVSLYPTACGGPCHPPVERSTARSTSLRRTGPLRSASARAMT